MPRILVVEDDKDLNRLVIAKSKSPSWMNLNLWTKRSKDRLRYSLIFLA